MTARCELRRTFAQLQRLTLFAQSLLFDDFRKISHELEPEHHIVFHDAAEPIQIRERFASQIPEVDYGSERPFYLLVFV